MAVLVGIDEAGYGPILGPLVVSGCVIEIPDELLRVSLWDVLGSSVCKTRKEAKNKIAINDSKKLHNKFGDVQHLQRGVLAAINCISGKTPGTFVELLQSLGAWQPETFAQYPWYRTAANEFSLDIALGDMAIVVANLRKEMQGKGVSLRDFWTLPLAAGHYNHFIDMTGNKAKVLFQQASQLIYRAWQKYGDQENLQVICDRQGGRSHYRVPLQRILPRADFKIIKETQVVSSYLLAGAGRAMKIHFVTKGDSEQLPVALASMASKYVRELMMLMLNRYFQQYLPQIRPTAGYYQDGTRFINELKAAELDRDVLAENLLIRQR